MARVVVLLGITTGLMAVLPGRAHVDAEIAIPSLSGTWRDSTGGSGTFAFTPGAASGGSPRPPGTSLPPSVTFAADGSIVARPSGFGPIPATGSGIRMMWYPTKAAFRAGTASFLSDDNFVGRHSAAFGNGTEASGESTLAAGERSRAAGRYGLAIGFEALAFGEASVALGFQTEARTRSSLAAGFKTLASGQASTALGTSTTASGRRVGAPTIVTPGPPAISRPCRKRRRCDAHGGRTIPVSCLADVIAAIAHRLAPPGLPRTGRP